MTTLLIAALVLAAGQPAATQPGSPQPAPAQPAAEKPAEMKTPSFPDSPFISLKAEKVADGYGFTEGPTWVPGVKGADGKMQAGFFVFCDMANSVVLRYDNGTEKPVALRQPSSKAVGSAADASGTVYNVDAETKSVTAWTVGADGKAGPARVVADKFNGEALGGMNDVAVANDGTLYVTHATWFLGRGAKSPFVGVLRVAKDGSTHKAAEGLAAPNGVCLSPDGKTLYVTEYSAGRVQSFPVKSDGTLGEMKLLLDMKAAAKDLGIKGGGGADGLRCDNKGNVYSTGPGGVWAISPAGIVLGHLPQNATNIAFGGADGKTLLLTTSIRKPEGGASAAVMKVVVKHPGAGW